LSRTAPAACTNEHSSRLQLCILILGRPDRPCWRLPRLRCLQWGPGRPPAASTQLLLVATSHAACTLLQHCFPGAAQVGAISLPPITPKEGTSAAAASNPVYQDVAAAILQPAACPGLLLVVTPKQVPAERAGAWARATLEAVKPQRLLVLAAMQVRLRGCGSRSRQRDRAPASMHPSNALRPMQHAASVAGPVPRPPLVHASLRTLLA
jgi:hypothetical protein